VRPAAALLSTLLALLPAGASALSIRFLATDLPDGGAAGDRWRIEYRLDAFPEPAGHGWSVRFDRALYADLQDPPPAPGGGWDVLVLQPDPALPDDGRYDALALVASAPVDRIFSVEFRWLGAGVPGAQPFEVYDASFAVVEEGVTLPVPEPGVASLVLLGLAGLAIGRRARGARPAQAAVLAAASALALGCEPAVQRVELGDFVLEYWQVAARRVSRTHFEYDFRARLTNQGDEPDEIQAWVTSGSDATAILDGALRFGPLAPGAAASSADVFRIRHDRRVAFDPAALVWLEMDRYGGWKQIAAQATGRFRVESIEGVWWFITPAGHAYYCAGVTGFDPFGDFAPALGTSPYHDHVLAQYGSEAAWAEVAQDRFRAWNLNCVGGWSDTALFSDRIPYAVNGSFMSRAPAVPGWPAGLTGKTMHDVFDPGFPANAALHAQGFASCAQNPWCIGVYSDNELAFGPGIFQVGTWVDAFMTLPAGAPGKLALQQFFEARYAGDLQLFNQVWGTQLADFDGLQALGALGGNIYTEPPERQQARQAFLGSVAARYFEVVHDALRALSPELLILGARFSPPFTSRRVIEASGPFVDVVSLNDYEFHPGILALVANLAELGNLFLDGPFTDLDTVYELTGKPLMITEYFYRLARSGGSLPPGLPEVADETERIAAYTRYQDEMLARPFMIGTHWFEWTDQPVEGRSDGENQLIGLVDIDDEPYPGLTERMTLVNGATLLRRAALASSAP